MTMPEAWCHFCGWHETCSHWTTANLKMNSHAFNCDTAKEAWMAVLTDDSPRFKFKEYPYIFRYTEGSDRLVYVFINDVSRFAMCAMPIAPDAPLDRPAYMEAAREWVRRARGLNQALA